MHATLTSSPKKHHRLIYVPAVAPLLMIGADFASIDGTLANRLSLPYSSFIYAAPLVAVAACIAAGLLLRRKLGALAWAIAYISASAIAFVPHLVVARYTQSLSLTRELTPGEKTAMRTRFPHPYQCSSNSEGARLHIRRSDYSASLVEFLRSIHAYLDP